MMNPKMTSVNHVLSRALVLLVAIALVSGAALAAEIRMKNRNLFKGEIIFESDTFVILDIGAGQITLQKADIKEIIRKDRFAVPPESEGRKTPSERRKPTPASAKEAPRKAKQSPKLDAKAREEAERKRKEEEQKKKEEEEERIWGLTSLEWEAEKIGLHKPGKPGAFVWKNLAEALGTIKEGRRPTLLYAYSPKEKREAYYYEKKVFPNPRFERLNLDFLLVTVDSTKEIKKGELRACMDAVQGKTGIVILNKDLTVDKKSTILGTPLPSPKKFDKFIGEALLAFKASKYKPGSIETFTWTPCKKAFQRMEAIGKPGLLYVFSSKPKSADDSIAAYLIETRVLSDERFRDLGSRFVMMKTDVTANDPSVPKKALGKVGITCWTFDKKRTFPWAPRGKEVDLKGFESAVRRAYEENEILRYQPGSDTSFNWYDLEAGIRKLKTGNHPALIYAYWPQDKRNAYYWEKTVFCKPELKGLSKRFVMIKGDLADIQKVNEGKLKTVRRPQSLVLLVAPDLKVLATATTAPDLKRFNDILERAEKALEKAK